MVGPFSQKDEHNVETPTLFSVKKYKETLVSSSPGTKMASYAPKGHVFKMRLIALQNDDIAFGKS